MNRLIVAVAALGLFALGGLAPAQVLGPDFSADYSVTDLGGPAGVPGPLGGITFLDSDTLLIGGTANNAGGAIYQIDVTRDPVTQSITGFAGPATLFATAPNIDGGLTFGPGGVLFYTGYSTNQIGQIAPGSVAPDKVINLNTDLPPGPGISSSVGTLAFVPAGFAGAGQLKVASYSASTWHTVTLVPDGTGTYDISAVSPSLQMAGGPEGIVYIDDANLAFSADSVLLSEYGAGRVSAYEIDANGDPIVATRRDFITDLTGAEGATIDPLTGDFFFSTFGGGNRVIKVTGFVPLEIPEPGTLSFMVVAIGGGYLVCRRRLAG